MALIARVGAVITLLVTHGKVGMMGSLMTITIIILGHLMWAKLILMTGITSHGIVVSSGESGMGCNPLAYTCNGHIAPVAVNSCILDRMVFPHGYIKITEQFSVNTSECIVETSAASLSTFLCLILPISVISCLFLTLWSLHISPLDFFMFLELCLKQRTYLDESRRWKEETFIINLCRTVSSCIWVSKHCRNFDTCIRNDCHTQSESHGGLYRVLIGFQLKCWCGWSIYTQVQQSRGDSTSGCQH